MHTYTAPNSAHQNVENTEANKPDVVYRFFGMSLINCNKRERGFAYELKTSEIFKSIF